MTCVSTFYLKYLQYMGGDDDMNCGPVVGWWQLKFLIVFFDAKLVRAMSSVTVNIGLN